MDKIKSRTHSQGSDIFAEVQRVQAIAYKRPLK